MNNQLLRRAVRNGDVVSAERFLTAGADPNYVGHDHSSMLEIAASQGDIDMLNVLIARGANPNPARVWGHDTTPLREACRSKRGTRAVIDALLDHGAAVTTDEEVSYWTHLHLAGTADAVHALRDRGVPVDTPDRNDDTPLTAAIAENKVAVARALLERGANASWRGHGDDLLGVACEYRALAIMELLLEHGADPNTREGNSGVPWLHVAVRRGDMDIVAILLRDGADATYVIPANHAPPNRCMRDDPTYKNKNAIDLAASPEMRDLLLAGRAAARPACLFEDPAAAMTTVAAVEAPVAGMGDGKLGPLHQAALDGNDAEVALLLAAGVDPDVPEYDISSDAYLESIQRRHRMVFCDDEGEREFYATNHYGVTPLHLAAQTGHANVIRRLLAHGADITGTRTGCTLESSPMFIASREGHVEAVRVLLEADAGAGYAQVGALHECLTIAYAQHHEAVTALLLEHGATPPTTMFRNFAFATDGATGGSSAIAPSGAGY